MTGKTFPEREWEWIRFQLSKNNWQVLRTERLSEDWFDEQIILKSMVTELEVMVLK